MQYRFDEILNRMVYGDVPTDVTDLDTIARLVNEIFKLNSASREYLLTRVDILRSELNE